MKTMYLIIAIVIILFAYSYIQNMPKKDIEVGLTNTYLIDGNNVTEKEFSDLKSKLTIEEVFTEGNLSVPVNADPDRMTMEYGTIQIHKAKSRDGGVYEYVLTSIGNSNIYNIQQKTDIVSDIKLEEIFYLKNNQTVQYKDISLTFTIKTLPFSKNKVTGMEQYPYDTYQVEVLYTPSTPKPKVDNVSYTNAPKMETITFRNTEASQKFSTDTMTYELHFLSYKDGVASFKLNTSFIEKHYEKNKASYILQISGGYFASEIYINNKFVNSINSPNSIHTTGFLINQYLSYEMPSVPEGKIVTPDMQGHNTIRIGPIKASSKDAKLHVKIIDKLNPEAVFYDKDIYFDTLGNNTVEIDLPIESDTELINQQQTLLE